VASATSAAGSCADDRRPRLVPEAFSFAFALQNLIRGVTVIAGTANVR